MTSPYLLDPTRSRSRCIRAFRVKRAELRAAQSNAHEAGNRPMVAALDREIDAIDARLKVLEGWL